MIGILLAVAAAILGAAVVLVAIVAWSIHREDRANTLAGQPRHPAYGIARGLMDVHMTGIVSAHGREERFTLEGSIQLKDTDPGSPARRQWTPRPSQPPQ